MTMENISLTEAVEQLFAQNGVEEIARRIRERGCLAYAPSGESLAQQEVCKTNFQNKVYRLWEAKT